MLTVTEFVEVIYVIASLKIKKAMRRKMVDQIKEVQNKPKYKF